MTLVCIGSGKMAEAIIQGLIKTNFTQAKNIICTDTSAERLTVLEKKYGVRTSISNLAALQQAQSILLAIKPQSMPAVLAELSTLSQTPLIISIAAGVTLDTLDPKKDRRVVRAMPNTPALISEAATAFACNARVTDLEKEYTKKLFSAIGLAVEVQETLLNAVTGLSGSGPAFVFRLIESFITGGVAAGLPEPIAQQLAIQTFIGAAKLARESTDSLEQLITNVTSPNGTTAAGRAILESSDVAIVLQKTIQRAKERADELSHT